jgi:ribosomal protein S18 acetylase RimI-like enzyme
MATLTKLLSVSPSTGQLRPLDARRDLNHVADLMERCFADTLDLDGQRYLRQMRSAASNPSYLNWATTAQGASVPISGYVWVEAGQLVGNLTLIPCYTFSQRYFLVANVAVHPDFRRRGIASLLTAKAIEHARQRSAQMVWLHVRAENEGAIRLYRSLGFVERARRTTWVWDAARKSEEASSAPAFHGGLRLAARRTADWRLQSAWLAQNYPTELSWHVSLKPNALRPDLWGFFYRFLNDLQVRQWSVWRGEQLLGVLAWQVAPTYADALWLAAHPEVEDSAAGALLHYAVDHSPTHRPLSLDYPAGRATLAIQSAGFHLHQTLIWMSLQL